MRRTLILLSLSLFGACAGPTDDPALGGGALTAEQCTFFTVDDAVTICHRTSSAKNRYVVIRTNHRGCTSGHVGHFGDYVSTTDPTCKEMGCYPEGAPADSLVPCCGGPAVAGYCPPIDACEEFPCGPGETCVDLPHPAAGDETGRECKPEPEPEASVKCSLRLGGDPTILGADEALGVYLQFVVENHASLTFDAPLHFTVGLESIGSRSEASTTFTAPAGSIAFNEDETFVLKDSRPFQGIFAKRPEGVYLVSGYARTTARKADGASVSLNCFTNELPLQVVGPSSKPADK